MSGIVPLPMGDLYRPYEYDEAGNIKQREDTLDPNTFPPSAAKLGPDVAAILMAENRRLLDEARAAKAAEK